MEVRLDWQLTLVEEEDRNGDDPRLQFVFLTTRGGNPIVLGQRTELLRSVGGIAFFRGVIGEPGGAAPPPPIFAGSQIFTVPPTRDDPYLGFVVRAIEEDNSKDGDRVADFGRLVQEVQRAATETPGGTPSASALWSAGNGPGLRNRAFRDDDDRIGVSARAYPDYGQRVATAARGAERGTRLRDTIELTELRFVEDGANWEMQVRLVAFA